MARNLVELVAVNEQEAPAVGRLVDDLVHHLDIAENNTAIVAQRLIVVAGNEYNPVAVPGSAQQLLHHRILGRRPTDAATHRPEVNNVANQIGLLGRVFAQEVDKPVCLARPGAKMNIGEKNRSDLRHDRRLRPPHDLPVTSS